MHTEAIQDLFSKFDSLHVVVVGDVMLDKYWWGDIERISPEAPVPIVALHHEESRLGGAANVALNLKALGAKVSIASVVGDDANGVLLASLCAEQGMDTSLLLKSKQRPTTSKIRVMSKNQHVLRLDDEVTSELSVEEEHPFIDMVLRFLQREKPQVLIFEDYNKGVLKENVIHRITQHCREIGVITAVDPKKNNFLAYKEVTIFKPNLKEVREGLHMPIDTVDEQSLTAVHEALFATLQHRTTFITLSEKGVYYNDGTKKALLPCHRRNIADVSGAGDTVIATAALVYAITKDPAIMAAISNIAGGIVCEEVGVVPIDKATLLAECVRLLQ
ncbi:MAG: bifunctional heptose 7-phosphate kinase/heptose 1-phosphate adenyltransferase [Bacteroidota bacterium]|jgi:rfaE bifunctional protein kinase chain/domain